MYTNTITDRIFFSDTAITPVFQLNYVQNFAFRKLCVYGDYLSYLFIISFILFSFATHKHTNTHKHTQNKLIEKKVRKKKLLKD